MLGLKYTFLITVLIMGRATFLVGVLPSYSSIGMAAPVILIVLRLLQGLALGGEYGGAATYVAEPAPQNRRGFHTGWIQTTATMGRSEEHTSELQSLMSISYDVLCLKKKNTYPQHTK